MGAAEERWAAALGARSSWPSLQPGGPAGMWQWPRDRDSLGQGANRHRTGRDSPAGPCVQACAPRRVAATTGKEHLSDLKTAHCARGGWSRGAGRAGIPQAQAARPPACSAPGWAARSQPFPGHVSPLGMENSQFSTNDHHFRETRSKPGLCPGETPAMPSPRPGSSTVGLGGPAERLLGLGGPAATCMAGLSAGGPLPGRLCSAPPGWRPHPPG